MRKIHKRLFPFVILMALSSPIHAQATLDTLIDRELTSLVSIYKTLHAAPELSHREEKTSAFIAAELRQLGFTVTERIGKFEWAEWNGYGVVAIMKNGNGPTVLVRPAARTDVTNRSQSHDNRSARINEVESFPIGGKRDPMDIGFNSLRFLSVLCVAAVRAAKREVTTAEHGEEAESWLFCYRLK